MSGSRSAADPRRLAVLRSYAVLDTAPEQAFDDLTALAARLFEAPVALVALVEAQRLWFKSRVGSALAQLPLGEGSAGEALLAGEVLVVSDAREDPRLQPFDGLREPGWPRFYAGAPLVSPEGAVLGMLCVLDAVPRDLDPQDRALLGQLAGQVMSQLELRRTLRAEASARASADAAASRLTLALSAGELGDWSWDPATDLMTLSARACEIYGIVPGSCPTRTAARELLLPRYRELARLEAERSVRERRDYDLEYEVRRTDGTVVWVSAKGRAFHDRDGGLVRVLGVVQDITRRKQIEARLQLSEAQSRIKSELAELTRDLHVPSDVLGVACRLVREQLALGDCGYALVGFDGQTLQAFPGFGPASLPGARPLARLADLPADVAEPLVQGRGVHLGGGADRPSYYWCPAMRQSRLSAIVSFGVPAGRGWREGETGVVDAVVDRAAAYVDRIQSRILAAESEQRLQLVADWMPQLAWMARPDGHVFWFNRRWYDYTGTDLQQAQGWGWVQLHHPDEAQRVVAHFRRRIVELGEEWEDTFSLRRRDGAFRWHLARALPLRDSLGNVMFWFGTYTDVTEQRQVAQEREALLAVEREARHAAEQAGRIKDEFLATLSHELRTPLTAVLGWSQVLGRAGGDPALVAQGLAAIERNARAQSQIIEDLLDMSAIVSGKIRLVTRLQVLGPIIAGAVDTMRPAAQAKSIRIDLDQAPADGLVLCDGDRLQQVFWNLVSNAIKFSDRGGAVRIGVERRDGQLQVAVSDTGRGIAPGFLPHVFERFRQADATLTREQGGLGLGLAIARQLVELHGGTITAASDGLGRGATFVVSLPAVGVPGGDAPEKEGRGAGEPRAGRQPEGERQEEERRAGEPSEGGRGRVAGALAADDAEARRHPLSGRRILVVDDEPDGRAMIGRLLQSYGADIAEAAGARDALALMASQPPDLLISDLGMPGMDGYALIGGWREREARRPASTTGRPPRLPAIALTAYADGRVRDRALAAGFDLHLAKPVEPATLVARVLGLLAGRAPDAIRS